MDITDAFIATIISSAVATGVALYLNRSTHLRYLNDQLDEIIKISIQYPYLESQLFVDTWNPTLIADEKYIRYENYCILLFNFLERYCTYFSCDEGKIQKELNVKDWVRFHKKYWRNPSTPFDNVDGYNKNFRKLINDYLK
jgi:hypothetical protein